MNWEIILSIVTISLSGVAIYISIKQTILSNKQSLFDRRLSLYMLVDELLSLYQHHSQLLEEDESFIHPAVIFNKLIQTNILKDCTKVMDNPLEDEEIDIFNSKMDELKRKAKEIEFVWKSKDAKYLSSFIKWYIVLLRFLYKQQVIIKTKSRTDREKINEELVGKTDFCLIKEDVDIYFNKIIKKDILKEFAKEIKL